MKTNLTPYLQGQLAILKKAFKGKTATKLSTSDVLELGPDATKWISLRYHNTNVATLYDDNNQVYIILNSGGYHTNTTKSRINQFLEVLKVPCRYVKQHNHIWYLYTGMIRVPFADGMITFTSKENV